MKAHVLAFGFEPDGVCQRLPSQSHRRRSSGVLLILVLAPLVFPAGLAQRLGFTMGIPRGAPRGQIPLGPTLGTKCKDPPLLANWKRMYLHGIPTKDRDEASKLRQCLFDQRAGWILCPRHCGSKCLGEGPHLALASNGFYTTHQKQGSAL